MKRRVKNQEGDLIDKGIQIHPGGREQFMTTI